MTTPLLLRLLGLSGLVIAFCLMTVLVHRTKVHAHVTRMLGLGMACALISCTWWINTPTFQTLSVGAQSFSSLLFFAIGIAYSGAVMHSRSTTQNKYQRLLERITETMGRTPSLFHHFIRRAPWQDRGVKLHRVNQ